MIFLVLIQIFELTEIRKHGKEFWLSKYSFGDTPPKINGSNLKMDALEDDVHIFSFSRGPVFSGSSRSSSGGVHFRKQTTCHQPPGGLRKRILKVRGAADPTPSSMEKMSIV